MRTIMGVLLINMFLIIVFPEKLFLYSEERQSDSLPILNDSDEKDKEPLYLPGDDPQRAVFLPIVTRKSLPPRENITLSVFAEHGDSLEVFEKNLDENGIPMLIEGFTNGNGYHPSYICRYALYVAAAYESNANEENYHKIQNLSAWIKENRVERNKFITWEFYEDLPSFNQTAPWTSALTNAWCSGALLQGYKITGDEELEMLARAGLEYLFTPVTEGGGMYQFDNGDIWFEECPDKDTPSHILNGFIYAIDVVDMFYSYYGWERYQNFFNRAVSSLVHRIDLYDVGYGSIYDLHTRGNKLGMSYHKLHILQLYYLYLRTGNTHLLEVSEKWYALQHQYEYELVTATVTNDNFSILHDGIYWYNYLLVKLPKQFTINFERPYDVQAINFFLYRDNNPTDSISISSRTGEGTFIVIPRAEFTIEWAGSNTTNGHITNVYTLTFDEPIRTQALSINFDKSTSNDTAVFREIGILKNLNGEYQEDYSGLLIFTEIINKRIQLIGAQ